MKKIVEAMNFFHQKNVIHRDLSLSNILYNQETNEIKIIDFGIAKKVDKAELLEMEE